ncbi:MAG TPA: hypothetical protein VGX76_23125, partial [Pirellulales bacterium]|nr:hypothetical protein [Pirellulales bacterium]
MNIAKIEKNTWFATNKKHGRRKDDRSAFEASQALPAAVNARCIGPLRSRQSKLAGSVGGTIIAEGNESLFYLAAKRTFDIVGALVLLVL